MSAPLKPCPFCGAKARMLGGPEAQETYSVWCQSRGRRHHVRGTMDADETAAIWNTRADAPELVALVAAAKQMRKAFIPFTDDEFAAVYAIDAAIAAYEGMGK